MEMDRLVEEVASKKAQYSKRKDDLEKRVAEEKANLKKKTEELQKEKMALERMRARRVCLHQQHSS